MSSIESIKRSFFDRDKVEKAINKGLRKQLSRFGAFVRTRSRSSIRKRKRSARPGEAPTSQTGLLKKFIYFSYDAGSATVVIGPAATKPSPVAPSLLEHGGTTLIRGKRKSRVAKYRPRPYMGPSFARELPKFIDSIKGCIAK
jgi:hypothetical protein